MTVYVGSSSKIKPASAGVGSTFYEHDTGQSFLWNGDEWIGQININKRFETICAAIEAAKPGDTIYVDSNGGDRMSFISHKMLQHTRMRFDSMTERQLWNRMGATTSREKLGAFAQIAEERDKIALAHAARGKLEELYGIAVKMPTKERNTTLKKSESGRILRRMDG